MKNVQWERMFPDELEAAFKQKPIVYFPYGLCEPHGPQNALGLDALKAHAICVHAAQSHGGIVAPPDYWHIHEIGGYASWSVDWVGETPRNWLTAMPPWQHFKNVAYHIRTANALGFHAAIFLTGHYGPNWHDLKTLIDLLQPHVGTRLYGLPDFEANKPGFVDDGKSAGDHAGKVETSLLWALEPDCVDVSRIPKEGFTNPRFAMGPDARLANRATGERMVNDEVKWLAAKSTELLAAYKTAKPNHDSFRTFEDVEKIWADVIRPKFKDFRTMNFPWPDQKPIPKNSVWYANSLMPKTIP